MGKRVTIPSVVDCHVHLRIPGAEQKEDFHTGSRAALAGGVSAILAMPNTHPPIVGEDVFLYAHKRAQSKGSCVIKHFVGATTDNVGISQRSQPIAELAAGLKLYINDTFGDLKITDEKCIREHLLAWTGRGPVAVHAEEEWVELLCRLAQETGQHVHFCHISRKKEIEHIAKAKEFGTPISCEVCPHHLFLTEEDAETLGHRARVAPPINTSTDRQALWRHLSYIDCIASDHAPHTYTEKRKEDAPPGFPGLETLLPLMAHAVYEDHLSLDRLVQLVSIQPRAIYRLTEAVITASKTVIEIGEPYSFPAHRWHSKSNWSPFAGKTVYARVRETYVGSHCAYKDARFYPHPNGTEVFDNSDKKPPCTEQE